MGYAQAFKEHIAKTLANDAVSLGLLIRAQTPASEHAEVIAKEYSRQAMSFIASGLEVRNATATQFPRAMSRWGNVVAYGLFDSGGNLVYQTLLDEPAEITRNVHYIIESGAVRVKIE